MNQQMTQGVDIQGKVHMCKRVLSLCRCLLLLDLEMRCATRSVDKGWPESGMAKGTPQKVGKLQAALHTKAKSSPDYRFYWLDTSSHYTSVCGGRLEQSGKLRRDLDS